jgi:DNA-binding NtrC family response regulator
MRPQVLVVEDDPERREVVRRVLAEAYDCRAVGTVDEAFQVISGSPQAAAVVDYDLSRGCSGLELLQALRESAPETLRVLYTVHFTTSLMRDIARLAHPHAWLDARPVDFLEELRRTLDELLGSATDAREARNPQDPSGVWTAVAPAAVRFLADLRRAAESHSPVYLFGEHGAGSSQAAHLLRVWRTEWKRRGVGPPGVSQPPVVILRVPSLAERRQDIPHLAQRLMHEHARGPGGIPRVLGADALEALSRRAWRGNLQELAAVLARASSRTGTRTTLHAEDLPHDHAPAWRPSQYAKDDGQRECMLRQLRAARNVSAAARLEGCSRANYIRMMRRLGVLRADVPNEVVLAGDEGV